MRLSGAMMLFLTVYFLWNCFMVIGLMVQNSITPKERVRLFGYLILCAIGVALFGVGTAYEIARLARMYG